MTHSIEHIERWVKRRLKRNAQKESDANYQRRALAILMLAEGARVSEVAVKLAASENSVRKWRRLYENLGEVGLIPHPPGKPATLDADKIGTRLLELVAEAPSKYGYLRSTWASEMLAERIQKDLGIKMHSSTIRRWLPQLGVVWNRARPTLCIPDAKKGQKMKAINSALRKADAAHPVFYVDEVDIDLNPKIGHAWMGQGKQMTVPTPGKNEKRYLCGALNATTGVVKWVEWEKKNAEIFIRMLAELRRCYRQARRITIILDNYVIHKSWMARCFLEHNPKFKLLFQPVYHPWVNEIEKLWKQLHDCVTRNHRYSSMNRLMTAVRMFLTVASPFPGTNTQLAKL